MNFVDYLQKKSNILHNPNICHIFLEYYVNKNVNLLATIRDDDFRAWTSEDKILLLMNWGTFINEQSSTYSLYYKNFIYPPIFYDKITCDFIYFDHVLEHNIIYDKLKHIDMLKLINIFQNETNMYLRLGYNLQKCSMSLCDKSLLIIANTSLKEGNITSAEAKYIFEMTGILGNQWPLISAALRRPALLVKNFYKNSLQFLPYDTLSQSITLLNKSDMLAGREHPEAQLAIAGMSSNKLSLSTQTSQLSYPEIICTTSNSNERSSIEEAENTTLKTIKKNSKKGTAKLQNILKYQTSIESTIEKVSNPSSQSFETCSGHNSIKLTPKSEYRDDVTPIKIIRQDADNYWGRATEKRMLYCIESYFTNCMSLNVHELSQKIGIDQLDSLLKNLTLPWVEVMRYLDSKEGSYQELLTKNSIELEHYWVNVLREKYISKLQQNNTNTDSIPHSTTSKVQIPSIDILKDKNCHGTPTSKRIQIEISDIQCDNLESCDKTLKMTQAKKDPSKSNQRTRPSLFKYAAIKFRLINILQSVGKERSIKYDSKIDWPIISDLFDAPTYASPEYLSKCYSKMKYRHLPFSGKDLLFPDIIKNLRSIYLSKLRELSANIDYDAQCLLQLSSSTHLHFSTPFRRRKKVENQSRSHIQVLETPKPIIPIITLEDHKN
ncbi:uncharacterized protein LOC135923590 isoform X2 [Gordionus sp. m RMFG-2023]|uniref:uncharacterized protein LOC135923590 isoform X2 n=1 Tax=Gordionus sp. m RMFG-2023 TaxID=3053472 RepID=UPI0031FCF007